MAEIDRPPQASLDLRQDTPLPARSTEICLTARASITYVPLQVHLMIASGATRSSDAFANRSGSGVIDDQSQRMTVAASAMADRKTFGQLS
ncbi:hypothetical protein [Roseovarius sp. SYSU LYC5161]|uniref:hypothetical protein n=1 Tax=Roseovarius halophilus (ex Wu et al. 2025) TaxID=3376060 RepID=UPI00399B355A